MSDRTMPLMLEKVDRASLALPRVENRVDPIAATSAEMVPSPSGQPPVELIRTIAELRALEQDWKALEDDGAASFNFFQSFDWSIRWTERFLPQGAEIVVAVGREDGRAVMIWPLMIIRSGRVRVLTWLSEPFLQYGGVLIARDVDRAPRLQAGWDAIRALPAVDVIRLRRVRADDPAAALLSAQCAAVGKPQLSCFLRLDGHDSHDNLVAGLPSRRRRMRRKLHRELEERGTPTLATSFGGKDFSRGMRTALRLKRQWLKETGQVSRAISDRRLDDFLLSFSGADKNAPRIAVGVLSSGTTPVAYEVAFHYRGHHYLYLITQEPEFVPLSPSKVQIDLTQKWALESGMKVFDLLAPEDRYKRDLTDETVEVLDFGKAGTMRGRAYMRYHTKVRPALKRAYLRWGAPASGSVRRFLGLAGEQRSVETDDA